MNERALMGIVEAIREEGERTREVLVEINEKLTFLTEVSAALAQEKLDELEDEGGRPVCEDGTCSKCDSASVTAIGEERDCKDCGFAWKVEKEKEEGDD